MPPFEADTPRMPPDAMAAGGEAMAVSFSTRVNGVLQQLADALKVLQTAMSTLPKTKTASEVVPATPLEDPSSSTVAGIATAPAGNGLLPPWPPPSQ